MSRCEVNLISAVLSGPVDINVILPNPGFREDPAAFYNVKKKYKVLWVLHGGNSDRNGFINSTNIVDYVQGHDIMVVMPNALNSDFANHPEFADGYNYYDFFFDELMPFIYSNFPASDKPYDNFLTGYSMGGAAAWMYGLSHPEKFGAIAPIGSSLKDYSELEKFRDMSSAEFLAAARVDRMLFTTGYGPASSGIKTKEINMIVKFDTVGDFLDSAEHTQYTFINAAKDGKVPKTYLPCATGNVMYKKILALQQMANELGVDSIKYEFIEGSSGDYDFVDLVMPKVIDFFEL